METDPATLVTGTPTGLKSPRVGDVLVERFEITEALESDCLVHTFRGTDQETDAQVLVRVTAPGLLGEKDARRLVDRLRSLVGATSDVEGSAWPTLIDVDKEGALVVTVEKMAPGASFRSVLDSRKSKNKRFTPAELLPVANKLCAALDGLASTGPLAAFHHGDLRAQRILVHPDGLTATGAFLVGALPGDAVSDAISRDVAMRRLFAPEVADGLAGRPADRFAVALLVWEALEGKPPPPAPRAKDSSVAKIGELLCRYLNPDPAARPSTLRPLVEALADGGKINWVPDQLATRAERAKALRAPSSATDLDPALVAAARAASAISNTGTFKLDDDELMPVTGSGPMPAPLSNKATSGAEAKSAAQTAKLKPATAKGSIPPPKSTPANLTKQAARAVDATEPLTNLEIESIKTSAVTQPAKVAAKAAAEAKSNTTTPQKRTSDPSPGQAPPRPKAEWEHNVLPKTAPLPVYVERETLVGPGPAAAPETEPERGGLMMVLGAVAIAIAILGAAFWYRARQEAARHEREVEAWIQAHPGTP